MIYFLFFISFSFSLPLSEAVETRHALHGVRWPTSNPKCLNVDFGSDPAMGKAIASTSDEVPKDQASTREERISGGWDRFEADEKRVSLLTI